jgi:hypothetical protein
MKVPEKIVFGFDIEKSGIEALKNYVGQVIWGGIKTQHLTSTEYNKIANYLNSEQFM